MGVIDSLDINHETYCVSLLFWPWSWPSPGPNLGPNLFPNPKVRLKPKPGMPTMDILMLITSGTTAILTIMSLARDPPIKNPPVAPCPDPDPMLSLMLPPTPTRSLIPTTTIMDTILMLITILTTITENKPEKIHTPYSHYLIFSQRKLNNAGPHGSTTKF